MISYETIRKNKTLSQVLETPSAKKKEDVAIIKESEKKKETASSGNPQGNPPERNSAEKP